MGQRRAGRLRHIVLSRHNRGIVAREQTKNNRPEADPRFRRWLAGLEPRQELIVRMAMRRDLRDPAEALRWSARIDELRDQLKLDAAGLAELLRAVTVAEREIAAITAPDRGPSKR
jgi:hypothetical protein